MKTKLKELSNKFFSIGKEFGECCLECQSIYDKLPDNIDENFDKWLNRSLEHQKTAMISFMGIELTLAKARLDLDGTKKRKKK